MTDVSVGLWVKLEAKPGKEADLEAFLRSGPALVDEEPETVAWFGVRLSATTFWIFDVFPGESGRDAHLAGRLAAALTDRAPELLAEEPSIEKVDVLASKLP
jgi:quinol monooxygenase YgiN